MHFTLHPLKLFKILLRIIAVLVCCGVITRLLVHFYHNNMLDTLCFIFNLDEEHNIPSVYSFFQLLVAGVILMTIALQASRIKDKFRRYWWLMAIIFFYLAFDELESFHERASDWLHAQFHTSGIMYFAWVGPALFLLLVLGIILLRFLVGLPADSRKRFLLAGSIFVLGAVGGEMVAGKYITAHGSGWGWPYVVEYHIEETLEMVGIAYFIYALLLHIQHYVSGDVLFRIEKDSR